MTHPIDLILNRPEQPAAILSPLAKLAHKRVLITGADGSIGRALTSQLEAAEIEVIGTDLGDLDVRVLGEVMVAVKRHQPDVIFHLAGDKHAPHGEQDASTVVDTNIKGAKNIFFGGRFIGARVIFASTCKACDPETVYGATKLIGERLALQYGETVARFYNVVETQGNVFELWAEQARTTGRIQVAPCSRYFISLNEAVALLLNAAVLEPGRYVTRPGKPQWMTALAQRLYPDLPIETIRRRQGDRLEEPLLADSEFWNAIDGSPIARITNYHDAQAAEPAAVAA